MRSTENIGIGGKVLFKSKLDRSHLDDSLPTVISPQQQLTNVEIDGVLPAFKSVMPNLIVSAW